MDGLQIQWTRPRPGWFAVEVVFGPLKFGLLLPAQTMRQFLTNLIAHLDEAEGCVRIAGPAEMPRGGGRMLG